MTAGAASGLWFQTDLAMFTARDEFCSAEGAYDVADEAKHTRAGAKQHGARSLALWSLSRRMGSRLRS